MINFISPLLIMNNHFHSKTGYNPLTWNLIEFYPENEELAKDVVKDVT